MPPISRRWRWSPPSASWRQPRRSAINKPAPGTGEEAPRERRGGGRARPDAPSVAGRREFDPDVTPELELADPERALAIVHAPAAVRPALTALFALDERLGAVVAATTEPQLGLIRLAWWREALARLDTAPAPAEPLLAALAARVRPHAISGAALAQLEGGWSALLDAPLETDAIARFGRERGGTLFTLAARLLGAEDPRLSRSGEGWALADLAHRHSDPTIRAEARRLGRGVLDSCPAGRWAAPTRPLAMLAALARRDLAVDGPRRQGAPSRLLRMLALRLTGF